MNCNNSWCINNYFIINIEYPDSVEYQCPRFSLLSRSWTIRPSAAGRVFLAKRTRSWWIPTRVRRAPLAGGRMRSWQVPSLVNETYMYIAWKNETFAIVEKYSLFLIHKNIQYILIHVHTEHILQVLFCKVISMDWPNVTANLLFVVNTRQTFR